MNNKPNTHATINRKVTQWLLIARGVMLNTHYIRHCIQVSIVLLHNQFTAERKQSLSSNKKKKIKNTSEFNVDAVRVRITENSISGCLTLIMY